MRTAAIFAARDGRNDMPIRMTPKSIAALTGIVLSGLAAPALGAETVVDQHDLMFKPNTASLAVGDTIRFTDTDHIAHNITIVSPDGTSDDKGMDTYMKDIVVPFAKAGVFQVHCRIHPLMKMTVTVK